MNSVLSQIAGFRRDLHQFRQALQSRQGDPLHPFRIDPANLLTLAGYSPDPWQRECLSTAAARGSRTMMLASRQSGKSFTAAAIGLHTALLRPNSLTILLSASENQAKELFRKHFLGHYHRLGRPVKAVSETALTMHLVNGSRILSLPTSEKTVRGYSDVSTLIIDEAARVPDEMYYAVRAFLATSGGSLTVLSTPFGKRGWFHHEWTEGEGWTRFRAVAKDCPRITPEFLASELIALGPRWYRQEYECSFEDTVAAVFLSADIAAMSRDDIEPLHLGL
jgi:hypothetical protein